MTPKANIDTHDFSCIADLPWYSRRRYCSLSSLRTVPNVLTPYRSTPVVPRTLWNFACCASLLAAAMTAGAAAPTGVEQEIMRLEQGSNDAYAANDLSKYFGYYAEDAMLIFYNERTSLAAYRKSWPESIKTEPIESVKLSDMVIRVIPPGNVAIASYQIEVRTGHPNGKATDEHAFETDVWVNRGGAWKIAHVHYSAKAAK